MKETHHTYLIDKRSSENKEADIYGVALNNLALGQTTTLTYQVIIKTL